MGRVGYEIVIIRCLQCSDDRFKRALKHDSILRLLADPQPDACADDNPESKHPCGQHRGDP